MFAELASLIEVCRPGQVGPKVSDIEQRLKNLNTLSDNDVSILYQRVLRYDVDSGYYKWNSRKTKFALWVIVFTLATVLYPAMKQAEPEILLKYLPVLIFTDAVIILVFHLEFGGRTPETQHLDSKEWMAIRSCISYEYHFRFNVDHHVI